LLRPREPDDLLAENIRRIFQERGIDFFDKHPDLGGLRIDDDPSSHTTVNTDEEDPTTDEEAVGSQAMTTEQLNKMRGELLQQLL
jgi:mediator of RNA polymerase II transcription subunit 17